MECSELKTVHFSPKAGFHVHKEFPEILYDHKDTFSYHFIIALVLHHSGAGVMQSV
jgi:hypothetical protein